jgi:hypothetical protein
VLDRSFSRSASFCSSRSTRSCISRPNDRPSLNGGTTTSHTSLHLSRIDVTLIRCNSLILWRHLGRRTAPVPATVEEQAGLSTPLTKAARLRVNSAVSPAGSHLLKSVVFAPPDPRPRARRGRTPLGRAGSRSETGRRSGVGCGGHRRGRSAHQPRGYGGRDPDLDSGAEQRPSPLAGHPPITLEGQRTNDPQDCFASACVLSVGTLVGNRQHRREIAWQRRIAFPPWCDLDSISPDWGGAVSSGGPGVRLP